MSNQIAQDYARQIDENMRAIVDQFKPYRSSNPAFLYERPAPEEWSVMENLAHLAEFPPYWLKEFTKVIKEPGSAYGRTHADPDRIAFIENHARVQLTPVLELIENARKQTLEMLEPIQDEDWEKTGKHSTRGEMNLHQMMDFFVTKHLRDHLQQTRAALQAAQGK